MPFIEYGSTKVEVDDEGYLVNFDDWNEQVACALAEREGIEELTSDRLEILRFIREYYRKFNYFPILTGICHNVHQPGNCVAEQFVSPVVAWKLAGLPKPDNMIINILQGETPD